MRDQRPPETTAADSPSISEQGSRRATHWASVQAYLQLLRLPNVFTAMADVAMGFLVVHVALAPLPLFLALLSASCLLYMAGMVLNDVYDVQVDAEQRPHRPLPSGRIELNTATRFGYALLAAGVLMGWLATVWSSTWTSGLIATLLAICVVSYDGWLKRTWLGPLAMGSCRLLNVLLGMSAGAVIAHPALLAIPVGLGIYITGVTWYARTEAVTSNRFSLTAATLVMVGGIGLLVWMPNLADMRLPRVSRPNYAADSAWATFLIILAALIGYRAAMGIFRPEPAVVQRAVKQAILSLVVLDAAVCFAFRGMGWSLAILALLLPTMFLGRWIYST